MAVEVTAFLDKSTVEAVPFTPGFYSCLFVVPKVTGDFALSEVLDLFLNHYITSTKFQTETVQMVLAAV